MVMHQVFCVYVIADSLVYFVGLLTVAVGVYLTVLTAFRTFFFFQLVALSILNTRTSTLTYILFCAVWLSSFGDLICLKGKIEWAWICGRGEVGATRKSAGRGNCGWGVKKKDKQYCQNKSFSILKYANFMIFILKHFTVCI